MSYITAADFQELEVDVKFLNQSVIKAEQLFEIVTRRFYSFHDFDSDFEWRKKAVRDALKSQVEYFIDQGVITAKELNSEPSGVTLGRTSISGVGNSSNSDKTDSNLLCDEFYLCLSGTGLLYRGAV